MTQSRIISVHSLEEGGVNMNETIYNKMLLDLRKFGIVDIADFSVNYLRKYLDNPPEIDSLQKQVDEEAVRLNNLDTWE